MTGRWLRRALAAGMLCATLIAGVCRGDNVVLVASPFPKEILSAYKQAFDAQSPDTRVEFLNFPATQILAFVRGRPPGARPDVFWGSSPEAFRALQREDLLEPSPDTANPDIPTHIGRVRINAADGTTLGQALSGYGIMWNTRYLAARGLTPPESWDELAEARYFGHVVMAPPSRSSTTHLIVESILQGKGWDDGWSLIMRLAGNAATLTERTFDVPNAITRGRFGLGQRFLRVSLRLDRFRFRLDTLRFGFLPFGVGLLERRVRRRLLDRRRGRDRLFRHRAAPSPPSLSRWHTRGQSGFHRLGRETADRRASL